MEEKKHTVFLKRIRNITLVLIVCAVAYAGGFRAGSQRTQAQSLSLTNIVNTQPASSGVDFSLFWDVWGRLSQSYLDKTALDPQEMIYGAISGMVESLEDPYTVFLPPKQNKEAKEDLGGSFEGIGAQLGIKEKKIVIVAPLEQSPAQKAGLKPGDWIIKVEGEDTIDWTLPETVSRIRGKKGSVVRLTIVHEGEEKSTDVSVVRDAIHVASVEWKKTALQNGKITDACPTCDNVIYLKLGRFGDQTSDEWNDAVDKILTAIREADVKPRGLIFDLRNNPGGYLSGSIFIASEFLPDGVIVIQEMANGEKKEFTVNREGRLLDIPMVVLVNKGSASASEIVAGALRDRRRARLVGETTFGKGTIQEAQELPQGAGLHITIAKWLLPSKTWINAVGLDPEIEVSNEETDTTEDKQLMTAMQILTR